jgi:O-methyltransferase involved in polyketide biosynthesis
MRLWSGHLRDIDRLVILGAGFDTRTYRLPAV